MRLDRKNKLLLAGILISVWICYEFALEKTVSEIKQHKHQKEISAELTNAPQLLFELRNREKQLDSLIAGSDTTASGDYQNSLLRFLSEQCRKNSLAITGFKEPHVIEKTEKLRVSTHEFETEGPFAAQIVLLDRLERTGEFGRLRHIEFSKKTNYRTGKSSLACKAFLESEQNLKDGPK